MGTRMTVIELEEGGLLVYSPISLSAEVAAEVEGLGRVRHIVAPNLTHHLYAGEWKEACPEALLHGAPGLSKRRPDLSIDRVLGEGADEALPKDVETVFLSGTMLGETLFFHPRSRTLLVADTLENFGASSHWPTRIYLRFAGILGKPGLSAPLRWMFRDKKAARRAIDEALGWDFDRIIVAHGDVIESGGKEIFRRAYTWLRG